MICGAHFSSYPEVTAVVAGSCAESLANSSQNKIVKAELGGWWVETLPDQCVPSDAGPSQGVVI